MRQFSGRWMHHSGDFWGGCAAMLVALPASVAFGVTVYAAFSPADASFGALAGMLGAMAIGVIAPMLGGTDRLISAPCAPAAAVLSSFAIEMSRQGVPATNIVLMMTVLGILTGGVQILIGFLGVGRLIKFIPYPVVSGYMSGVGLIMIGSQLPKFAGAPANVSWFDVLLTPQHWDWRGMVIGSVTVVTMFLVGRVTRKIPATIMGILAGGIAYTAIAVSDPAMQTLEGNKLVIGALGSTGEGYLRLISERWYQIGELKLSQVAALIGSALTLAVLLSIDTLKTCVVLDQTTRTRHDSDRELVAQGIGNIAASVIGGIPGSGTMGASMVNSSSGAQTRVSGVIEGVLVVVGGLLLGSFVAWLPVATLSGVLIVVGIRMIDTDPFRFLESSSTLLDFSVVLVVVIVALSFGLIWASLAGVVLSVVLFLREQVGGNVLRRKSFVSERSSAWYRPEAEVQVLRNSGRNAVIFELQGSLFFGTAQQLYRLIESELNVVRFLILDLQRVQSVDVTAAHILCLIRDILAERDVPVVLSSVHEHLPNGRDLREFLELAGLEDGQKGVVYVPTLQAAIEWVEDRLLTDLVEVEANQPPLDLYEIELFKGSKPDTLVDLEEHLEKRTYKAGELIFRNGEATDDLYLIRRGEVRVMGYVGHSKSAKHIATYGRGDFVGGLSFLDHSRRSNDAVAITDCDMYVLSREGFEHLAEEHKRIAFVLVSKIARMLAIRLRHTNEELAILQDT